MKDDSRVVHWLDLVRACETVTQRIERVLAREHQICASAFELLFALSSAEGWVRLVDLNARVTRSQSQVSRLISQMVEADVVERTTAPEDGRGSQVRLTAAGRRLLADATSTVDLVLRQADLPRDVAEVIGVDSASRFTGRRITARPAAIRRAH